MPIQMQDKLFADQTFLGPNGAAVTYQTGWDLEIAASSPNDFTAGVELELTCPDLEVGDLANGETITFALITDDALPLDASSTVVYDAVEILTGAGGVGATGFTKKVAVPSDVLKYVGFKAVKTGATGDASNETITAKLLF